MNLVDTFLLLLAGHMVADYPLQGDFLAKAKNRFAPVPGVPFYHALGAHAAIHGGMVGLITGSALLGLAEFCLHAFIDDRKCAGAFTYEQDQLAHICCKASWVIALWIGGPLL